MPGPKQVNIKAQHQCKPLSFSYYIGRLQRSYAGFNTNMSWLSLDHFFTSVLQPISLKRFFFAAKKLLQLHLVRTSMHHLFYDVLAFDVLGCDL